MCPTDQAPSWSIPLGTKSVGRQLFISLGIPVAEGYAVNELARWSRKWVPWFGPAVAALF